MVAPLALIVSALGLGAASASEHVEPATVVVHDDLGDSDWIETSLPRESAEQKLRSAAEAARIPVFGVEEVSEESGVHGQLWRLNTTIGTREGRFRRLIPAQTLQPFATFGGPIQLSLPGPAVPAESLQPVEGDPFRRSYQWPAAGDVLYEVPGSFFLAALAVILLAALMPFVLLRGFAWLVDRRPLDRTEKVHRLRVASFVGIFAVTFGALAAVAVTGIDAIPQLLIGEFLPTVSLTPTVDMLLSMTGASVVLFVGTLAAVLAVHPYDRRLRETRQTVRSGLRTVVAGLAIGFAIPLVYISTVTLLPPSAGWLVVGTLLVLGFPFLVAAVSPLLVMAMWRTYRLDEHLRRRLLQRCQQEGFEVRDVRAIEGRTSKMANALVSGIVPRFRYVFLTDYLLDEFEDDEVEAVLAHEIGHGKGRHLILKAGVAVLLSLVFAALLLGVAVAGLLDQVGPIAFVVSVPIGLFILVLIVHGSLGIILERRADDYAAQAVGLGPMVRALEKLADLNLTKRRTGFVWNLLTQHPGIEQRVERLRARIPRRQPT